MKRQLSLSFSLPWHDQTIKNIKELTEKEAKLCVNILMHELTEKRW